MNYAKIKLFKSRSYILLKLFFIDFACNVTFIIVIVIYDCFVVENHTTSILTNLMFVLFNKCQTIKIVFEN